MFIVIFFIFLSSIVCSLLCIIDNSLSRCIILRLGSVVFGVAVILAIFVCMLVFVVVGVYLPICSVLPLLMLI